MKSIVICALLVVAFGVFVEGRPNSEELKLAENALACMKEHNLKLEDFEKFKKNEDFNPDDVTYDMKCAIHCITQKTGIVDENGKMKPDEIRAMLNDEEKPKFEAAYNECSTVGVEDPCETAFLTFGCMAEHKISNVA